MSGAAGRLDGLRAAGAALKERPAAETVAVLDAACARWRDPAAPARTAGEEALAARYGVPRRAIATVLDAAFGAWDGAAMRAWIEGELGALEALDRPVRMGPGRPGALRMARGPDLVLALSAHGVPTTPVADLLAALLVKAPVWIKPATGADDLAARFAATLAELDSGIAAAAVVEGWAHGSEEEAAALAAADVVVATGRAETLARLSARAGSARVLLHGPRISAAVVTREAMADPERVVAALADDAAFAGQMGCLSPAVVWVEAPGPDVAALVEPLQAACEERWPAAPRAEAGAAERARFAEWLALAGVERAAGAAGPVAGGFDTAWSVQARAASAPLDPPPVPRVVVLSPVTAARDAAELCARRRGEAGTVGLAAPPARAEELTAALARAGVERVAPLGAMQRPPLSWRRDGRATLSELVRWFDLEE